MKMKSLSPSWSPIELFAGAEWNRVFVFLHKGKEGNLPTKAWTQVDALYPLMGCEPVLSTHSR